MSEEKKGPDLKAGDSDITAQIVVRDKDGNIKYQGPLYMKIIKEQSDGSNPLDGR